MSTWLVKTQACSTVVGEAKCDYLTSVQQSPAVFLLIFRYFIIACQLVRVPNMCLGTNVHVSAQTRLWPHDYNMSGHKCVWAQTCVGIIVCGHKRVWAQTCVGTIVCGHKRVWAQTCLGTNVSGHYRVWAQSCLGTIMSGHAQSCLGTIMSGHNHVWGQSCGHNRVGSSIYGHNRVVSDFNHAQYAMLSAPRWIGSWQMVIIFEQSFNFFQVVMLNIMMIYAKLFFYSI